MAESHIIARVHPSVLDLPAEPWNALLAQQTHATPFMRHEYLAALERSGSATPRTGWTPRFLSLWDDGVLIAACPLYLKDHSYGEYVFDWAWANAYEQHGVPYYPKAVVAVPFTPVPGSRLLARDDDARALRGKIQQRLTDGGGGTGIDTPGGLVHHQHARIAQHFAADDEFLQVPARERTGGGAGAGGAHVECPDHRLREIPRGGMVDQPAPDQVLAAACGQKRILGQAEFGDGGMAQPVLGGREKTCAAPRLGGKRGEIRALKHDGARRGRDLA